MKSSRSRNVRLALKVLLVIVSVAARRSAPVTEVPIQTYVVPTTVSPSVQARMEERSQTSARQVVAFKQSLLEEIAGTRGPSGFGVVALTLQLRLNEAQQRLNHTNSVSEGSVSQ